MDNKNEMANAPEKASVAESSQASSQHNTNVGAAKTDKLLPTFRIVEAYDKRELYSSSHKGKCKTAQEYKESLEEKKQKGCLYAEVAEPVWHDVHNSMVTPPIIAQNIHLYFKDLPLSGAPEDQSKLQEFEDDLIREYVGFDLDEAEYEELRNCCNPNNLKTGDELVMPTKFPCQGLMDKTLSRKGAEDEKSDEESANKSNQPPLWTLKRIKKRNKRQEKNTFTKLLKYRGTKHYPLKEQDSKMSGPPELIPGKDVIYRIRVYRPFSFVSNNREKTPRGRHSIFSHDILVTSRTPLTMLRDRFTCRNDLDMRLDMSQQPEAPPTVSAKTIFPSGFLFINNVFYVDNRKGCHDTSATIRRWAQQRRLGTFPVRSMAGLCVGDVLVRLAHPEVYMHQGSCEHLFVFSEMRLLTRSDPLHLTAYPCNTIFSQNQSLYCTTCAEFCAKWLVTGSDRVPFDPAFFCDLCFKEYMYKDNKKIGDFKAYAYRGNEIHTKSVVSNYTMVLDYN